MKIIKISAMWCPSCLIMNDLIDEVIDKYNVVEYTKYDFDLDQEEVSKFNVGNILPVIIKLDENNNEISRLIGEKSKKELEEFLEG